MANSRGLSRTEIRRKKRVQLNRLILQAVQELFWELGDEAVDYFLKNEAEITLGLAAAFIYPAGRKKSPQDSAGHGD